MNDSQQIGFSPYTAEWFHSHVILTTTREGSITGYFCPYCSEKDRSFLSEVSFLTAFGQWKLHLTEVHGIPDPKDICPVAVTFSKGKISCHVRGDHEVHMFQASSEELRSFNEVTDATED